MDRSAKIRLALRRARRRIHADDAQDIVQGIQWLPSSIGELDHGTGVSLISSARPKPKGHPASSVLNSDWDRSDWGENLEPNDAQSTAG